MKSFLKTLITITILVLTSCGEEKNEVPNKKSEIRYNKQKELDTFNKNNAVSLSSKLNAIQSKDNGLMFTYQIQQAIKDSNRLFSVIGSITDIIENNGKYFFKIYGSFSKKNCLYEISASPDMFQKIISQIEIEYLLNEVCFVFKPTGIKSSSLLTIDSEVSGGEIIEDAESSLTYDFEDEILLFKGSLIDYYVYKQLLKEEP